MKTLILSGCFSMLAICLCLITCGQVFDTLVLDEISPIDSAGIYRVSGQITDVDAAERAYYIYLQDRYNNVYLQRPSCSIMGDSVFNHYNTIILPYNNRDVLTIHVLSVKLTDKKSEKLLKQLNRLTSAGIPEPKFKQLFPSIDFLPHFYEIESFR